MQNDLVRYLSGVEGASGLSHRVEAALRDGTLRPGDPLPPIRSLAAALGFAPATVASAYRELGRRGIVVTEGRRGTRIAPRPPVAIIPAHGALFQRTGQPMSEPTSQPIAQGWLDLASGSPDPALLPDFTPFLCALSGEPRLYGVPSVLPELRKWAAPRWEAEGIPSQALTAVGGAMDGVERALMAHARPGDRVAVEDPGYPGVLDLVGALGLIPEPFSLDDEGPTPASLRAALERRPVACVLTPRAQNPTGAAFSEARARELRRILGGFPDCLVIEDDHAGPVCGAPLHPVAPASPRWVHVRSLSKSLGPDLRVALLAGDPQTVARIEGRRDLGTGWVSLLLQELAFHLLSDAGVTCALARAEEAYAVRRCALIESLRTAGVEATGVSGLNVWVPSLAEAEPVAALASARIAVRAGERYRLRSGPGIRITVSRLDASDAPALAAQVAQALRFGQMPRGG
jgi:DNA-binding transcriptional MocR family regulator